MRRHRVRHETGSPNIGVDVIGGGHTKPRRHVGAAPSAGAAQGSATIDLDRHAGASRELIEIDAGLAPEAGRVADRALRLLETGSLESLRPVLARRGRFKARIGRPERLADTTRALAE